MFIGTHRHVYIAVIEAVKSDATRLRCIPCSLKYHRETTFVKTSLGRHLISAKHTSVTAEDTSIPAIPSAAPPPVSAPVNPTALAFSREVNHYTSREITYQAPNPSHANPFDDVFIGDDEIVTANGESVRFSAGSLYSRQNMTHLQEELGSLGGCHISALPLPLVSEESSSAKTAENEGEPPPEEDSFISPMLEIMRAMGELYTSLFQRMALTLSWC